MARKPAKKIVYENLRHKGQVLWFEYRCNESHDSEHAQWWYRSHQQVTVLKVDLCDGKGIASLDERCECGQPIGYKVKWADGFVGDVCEDELLDSPDEYINDPPPTLKEIHAAGYQLLLKLPKSNRKTVDDPR